MEFWTRNTQNKYFRCDKLARICREEFFVASGNINEA